MLVAGGMPTGLGLVTAWLDGPFLFKARFRKIVLEMDQVIGP